MRFVISGVRLARSRAGRRARLSYIDSHSKLLSRDGEPRPEILRADGLHLNGEGYALWLKILKPAILRLAKQAPGLK